MRAVVRSKGGGGGSVPWKPLICNPGAIVDAGSLTTTGTSFDGNGRLTIAYNAAHVSIVDGYQEAVAYYQFPLLSLIPNFDPDRHNLQLQIDSPTFPHVASVATGLIYGIADSTTTATRKGAAISWRTATIATDTMGLPDITSNPSTTNPGLCDAMIGELTTGLDGSGTYPYAVTAKALIEGTTRVQQVLGGMDSDNVLTGPTSNWQIFFGAYHGSVTAPTGIVIVADLYYRLV